VIIFEQELKFAELIYLLFKFLILTKWLILKKALVSNFLGKPVIQGH